MKRFLSLFLAISLLVGMVGCAAQSERVSSQPRPARTAATRTRVGVWEEHDVIYSTGVGRSKKRGEAMRIARENAQRGLTAHIRTHYKWVKATEDMGSETAYNEGHDPDTGVYTVYVTVMTGKPINPATR